MASSNFRDSMNSLGWSRREPDLPVNTSSSTPILSRLQSLNPFADRGGYVSLPTHTDEAPGAPLPAPTRREEEEGFFALSRWDRILIFAACNVGAAVCFIMVFIFWFVLLAKPRKFAILWSAGSLLFLASWAVLLGPYTYAKHLISGPRLPFTAIYFGSIAITLYSAVGLHSTILTLIFSLIQLASLVWYLVSYFPMGSTGLRYAAQFGTNRVMGWMS